MNVFKTTRIGVILLLVWGFASTILVAAPVKLNSPLISGHSVNYLRSSPDGSRVLYLANQAANSTFELFSVPAAGGVAPTRLNGALVSGGDVSPSGLQFSPDGSQVLYVADQSVDQVDELFIVPSAGGTPLKLNGPLVFGGDVLPSAVHFGPDGSRVLYLANQAATSTFELFSVPAAGGVAPTRLNGALVSGGDVSPSGLQFSPDGSQVLYVADQSVDQVDELFIVPSAGGTPLKLNGPLVFGGDVLPSAVHFSPDGSRVLYLANQAANSTFELFSVPAAGGVAPTRLNGALVSGGDVSPSGLQFSPDGSQVLYVADQSVDQVDELFIVPSAGGTPLKLNGPLVFGGDVLSNSVRFDPNGNRVLYLADQDINSVFELYSVPSSGGVPPTKLNVPLGPGHSVSANGLQFSPDGSRILYHADQDVDEIFEIYSVPSGGGAPVKLNGPLVAGGDVSDKGLQFSPDGSRILYLANQVTNSVDELFIVPSSGGTPVKINGALANGGDVTDVGLQFSPDGSRVLYRADQDTDDAFEIYSRVIRQYWNSGSGDWNVATNWDQLEIPDEVMQVIIDQPVEVTVPSSAIGMTVNDLRLGGGAGTSSLMLEAGATLSAINGLTILAGGVIRGLGSVQADVVVAPGGMLEPGSSEGVLEVDRLTMNADSLLSIEIGDTPLGTDNDQLVVGNDATLGGLLAVTLTHSFIPAANHSFTILASAALAGSFSNAANGARLGTLGGEGSFVVNYNAVTNSVILSDFMASLGLPGDYNGDGSINAADYTVWRDALTAAESVLLNDPTPGTVDESDFLYWRAHFGESVGGGAVAGTTKATVPEPSAYLLVLGGWAGLLYWGSVCRRKIA